MGRLKYATRNIMFGYVGNLVTALLGFAVRTVFIARLGDTLNGVNSLYTDLLSMLSLAELGIGTALNFSLYAPVAKGDTEKIKSYMHLYKQAYRIIAFVIAGIGVALIPFLQYIVKSPDYLTLSQLRLYYVIFLFNTVSTYFVAYKYSLVNAEQKNYIQTNIQSITKMVTVTAQILVLLLTSNFLAYLLTQAAVELIQKIFVSMYLNRKYPYLLEKNVQKLTKEEKNDVVKKTKALMIHKLGDMARLQTDSIIISGFLGVVWVGLINNYKLVINQVSNIVNVVFNSVISSFGNLIATEGKEKQFQLFQVYRFVAIWVYGFSAVGFFLLLSPLVELWLGKDRLLANSILVWVLIDYFLKGERVVLSNFKTAAGVFEQDKYLTLIQGGVNLVISLVLVQRIGMAGVYIGTVVSGLIANISKPIIIYHVCFDKKAGSYFAESLKYIVMIGVSLLVLEPIKAVVISNLNIFTFLLMALIITIVFNAIFFLFFRKAPEFQYVSNLVEEKVGRKIRKFMKK